ncbi:MAG: DUF4982 domain-containing protein [Bacteroidaceae bacterium]|nr:DUF4982 domain-containing protein [Bacteroidaceae bacterium]
MKKTGFTLLMLLFAVHLMAQKSPRTTECFDDNWQFHLTMEAGTEQQAGPRLADAIHGWETVQLPHDWSIHMIPDSRLTGCNGHLRGGKGEYKKTFSLPAADKGKAVSILFDGIYNRSRVYLNGHLLGFRPYGFVQIEYDLTPYLNYGKENELYVTVNNPSDNDSIARWYTGSGIYRHAWLVKTNPVHIATNGTYIVTQDNQHVVIKTTLVGTPAKARILHQILDADGKVVAKGEGEESIRIPHPHLWNGMEDPYLYKAVTRLYDGGKLLDTYESTFGIRTVEFTNNEGFLLNGKRLKLKGFCLHQDDACLGSALPRRSMERRLELFKAYGVNAIRCSHNPPAPEFLDLCDQMGFIVIDEAFDKWKSGYYKDYFDEWWQRDMENMIERDRNHPSVAVWSIGNELQEAWDGSEVGANRAKMLQDFVHQMEPSRQVCMACQNNHQDHFAAVTDVVGYNYQEPRMVSDHKRFPERKFVVTEELPYYCGAEGNIRAYDTNNPWNIIEANDFIAGGFLWTGQDYVGEAGWPSCGWPTGLIDLSGTEKAQAVWHHAIWQKDKPTVGIAVRDEGLDIDHGRDLWQWPNMASIWNFPFRYEGLVLEVQTITNCERVQLLINGKVMGEKRTADFPNHTIVWHVPYTPGHIEAKGINGTDTVASYALRTAGDPVALKATPDRTILNADGQDLSYIQLQLVDKDGNPVPHKNRRIKGTIEGEGRLIGLISNDLRRTTPFTSTEDMTYFGRAFAVVQSTKKVGSIRLRLDVDGFSEPVYVEMTTK